MTVHDQAHLLARSIKDSDEYKQYMFAKDKAAQNPELAAMINDFRTKQFDLQRKQMAGEVLAEDVMTQAQALYQILLRDPVAAEYVQAELRFTLMVNDVYSILGEVITDNGGIQHDFGK
ncbi:MAG: YlbF family regulator [Clostridiales Family XIII bacterium]|jgi:cell fate (sporulation/competence/biofilm development) regulator YlbF (YheA/YmcA/DUF963 family)|nr:YlbF family regulator [Clostridiales Family XIII bacterium]